ncbi:RteC domain-containing protein [Pedobacter jeongneungensis]|uniref:RteC domain-containing protein n=1 Tax=Pedobacter jeongneungensis TaxID=947309 RepID=UPI00046976EB|nr:RteC domain-containing protein [Pedobacter jeongneungensis]
MKLQKLSEKLYAEVLPQIEEITTVQHSLEKFRDGLAIVQKALVQLKVEHSKTGFADEAEEIYFFKKGKPRIYALLIFITELYAIENSMPLLGKDKQICHLESQLQFINRFFRQNEFIYQYYRLGATDLDDRYFTRNGGGQLVGFAEVPDVDPSFSTVADYLFSKFIAYEKLQESIKQEIVMQKGGEEGMHKNAFKDIKWTGEAVNMVELVYGVYETGQVNGGKISLSELMEFFSHAFQVNISGYFKRFADIKRRKSMSKTRYLDEMQQLVSKRIEDSDAWIPEDQRSRYGF